MKKNHKIDRLFWIIFVFQPLSNPFFLKFYQYNLIMQSWKVISLMRFPTGKALSLVVLSIVITSTVIYVADNFNPSYQPVANTNFYPVSKAITVNDKNYWVGFEFNSKSGVNNTQKYSYILIEHDTFTKKITQLPLFDYLQPIMGIDNTASEVNHTIFYAFSLMGINKSLILLTIKESQYITFSQGYNSSFTYRGFPAEYIKRTFYLPIKVEPSVSIDLKSLVYRLPTGNMSVASLDYYGKQKFLLLFNEINQTGPISNFREQKTYYTISSKIYQKLMNPDKLSQGSPVKFGLLNNTHLQIDFREILRTPKTVDNFGVINMTNSQVNLIDSKGRIHLTGSGTIVNNLEGNYSGLNRANYVMIDPTLNKSYYWQLLPYPFVTGGALETLQIFEVGSFFGVLFNSANLNGFYQNVSNWDRSQSYNDNIFLNKISKSGLQLSLFDPTHPTNGNYLSFANSSVSFPRLNSSILVQGSAYSPNYMKSERTFVDVLNTDPNRIELMVYSKLYKVNNTYLPSIGNCGSSIGEFLTRVKVTGSVTNNTYNLSAISPVLGPERGTSYSCDDTGIKRDITGVSFAKLITFNSMGDKLEIVYMGVLTLKSKVSTGLYIETVRRV